MFAEIFTKNDPIGVIFDCAHSQSAKTLACQEKNATNDHFLTKPNFFLESGKHFTLWESAQTIPRIKLPHFCEDFCNHETWKKFKLQEEDPNHAPLLHWPTILAIRRQEVG